jgi:hypothetical protein
MMLSPPLAAIQFSYLTIKVREIHKQKDSALVSLLQGSDGR